jgi:putative PIN family toxin of toxin-antitoxin system
VNRVVFDTNVVVSAFLWGGTSRLAMTRAIETGVLLLATDDTLNELEKALNKPKFDARMRLAGKTSAEVAHEYTEMTTRVIPSPIPAGTLRDGKDDIILAAAVGGNATHLISGDKDLTELAEYEAIRILTPAQFLALLDVAKSSEDIPPVNE